MNRSVAVALILIVAGIIAFVVLRSGSNIEPPALRVDAPPAAPPRTETPPEPPVVEVPAEPAAVTVEEPPVPAPESLEGSDLLVPVALEKLSPPLLQWVVPDEQVRKLVLAVDLLAAGKLPQRHKPIAYDMAAFAVVGAKDDFQAADKNLDRLTPLVNAAIEIDPKTLGRYYQAWLPVMESAYAELGKKGTFKQRVQDVIKRIQQVGPAPENAVLVRPNVLYQYADPALENRSALEKWLWRMGDENREKIQNYLREISFYL